MKKLFLGLTAASLLVTSLAYANTNKEIFPTKQQLQSYTTNTTPLLSAKGGSSNLRSAPTEVVVVNATGAPIYVTVPGGPPELNDRYIERFGRPLHIRNWNGEFTTPLVVYNSTHGVMWNNNVCPRAIVVPYTDGSVFIDTELC